MYSKLLYISFLLLVDLSELRTKKPLELFVLEAFIDSLSRIFSIFPINSLITIQKDTLLKKYRINMFEES